MRRALKSLLFVGMFVSGAIVKIYLSFKQMFENVALHYEHIIIATMNELIFEIMTQIKDSES